MATAGRNTRSTKVRKKEKKNVVSGHAHIKSTFNNTVISITDPTGAVIAWASAGTVCFKGSPRGRCDRRRHPRAPQRLPPSQAPPRLTRETNRTKRTWLATPVP